MNDKALDFLKTILDSDLPLLTKNNVVKHYFLPKEGQTLAIIQEDDFEVGLAERPTAEEVKVENNPKLKAEYVDTEKVMTGKVDDEDEEE